MIPASLQTKFEAAGEGPQRQVGAGEQPGGAATTDRMALSAGMPVTVMPIEAKVSGSERSAPGFGKIMCLL